MSAKTLKWAYEMGAKHERERIERELFQKLGNVPQEPVADLPSNRQLDRFYIARNRWYAIQGFLNGYFGRHNDFDPDQLDRLMELL